MTDDKEEDAKLPAGSDKRPRVTLELKATEVPDDEASKAALSSPEHKNEEPSEPVSASDASDAHKYDNTPPVRGSEVGATLLVTHLLAGLAGGVIALVAGFYGLDRFRDRIAIVNGVVAEDLRSDISATSSRLALLEKSSVQPAAPVTVSAEFKAMEQQAARVQDAYSALQKRVVAFEEKLANTPTAAAPDDGAFKATLGAVEGRILTLETKLAAVAKTQNSQKSSVAATALAVAFTNLRRAVATGRPYSAEFEAVAKLGAPEADLTALSAHRETGLKSPEALEKSLTPLIKEALRAEYGKDDASFVSRLWTEAKSVVRIRPTGDLSGDTSAAILARAESRVRARDIGAAAKEAETLKGQAAVILQPWLAEAKARAAGDTALDQIEAKLLASLKTEGASQ